MASKDSEAREVIAHFSTSKLIVATVGTFGFAILGSVMARDMLWVRPTDDHIKYGLNVWGFAIFFVAMALMFFYLFRAVRAAMQSKGIALWLQGGRLVHADKQLLDVCARDVSSVELIKEAAYQYATSYRVAYIVLRLKNGKEVKLSASAFSEHRDDIVVELRKRLGLVAEGNQAIL